MLSYYGKNTQAFGHANNLPNTEQQLSQAEDLFFQRF